MQRGGTGRGIGKSEPLKLILIIVMYLILTHIIIIIVIVFNNNYGECHWDEVFRVWLCSAG